MPISRPNFIELCHELTVTDEAVFEALFRRLGQSFDWSFQYETINDLSRRTSQVAFLRNLARGEAYSAEAPTVWDVDDRTAVAQAEIEDRERPGHYHLISFHGPDGDVLIDTTRPELLVSCVAMVAHPDDERFAGLVGSTVRTPVFGVEVPVVTHPLAQPDKGTGIAMVCTFGDTTDVTWWRELDLPTRSVIGRDGRIVAATPSWLTTDAGRTAYGELAGKTVKQAQAAMVELLRASGDLHGEPRPITHPVKFYERGSRPLEIVTSRQWYIRNGGRDQDRRDAFITRGKELNWFPDHMRHRYDHWVEGLNGDWLISRQRFFGVPIPLWYPVGDDGAPDYDQPIVPAEDTPARSTRRPTCRPATSSPQRGAPGGFVGDADIMDTWATSSLTPQIGGHWVDDPDLWSRVFPMDIRPQGPEIIRTWLFSTVVRSHYEHGTLPWANATLNGWILDPDRKKMSKSKGNVVTPMPLFEQYGTDAVRYWAISARPGVDTVVSEEQMKVGRRLATKLLNVTKFVLGLVGDGVARRPRCGHATRSTWRCSPGSTPPCPRRRPRSTASTTPAPSSAPRRSSGGSATTTSSWSRAGRTAAAATARRRRPRAALRQALDALLRLLAPTLPFATEEAWSWSHDASVHVERWPRPRRRSPTRASTSTPSARCWRGSGGPRPRPSSASAPPSLASSSARAGRRAGRHRGRPRRPRRRRSPSPSSIVEAGDELAVDAPPLRRRLARPRVDFPSLMAPAAPHRRTWPERVAIAATIVAAVVCFVAAGGLRRRLHGRPQPRRRRDHQPGRACSRRR